MPRLSSFLMGFVLGVIALYICENYYVVRSKETVNLVRKVASKIEVPYYDIRNYTSEDWRTHPSLALAIVKSKKENLLVESGLSGMQTQFEGFLKSLGN
jgi:hypothetical protein